MLGDLLLEPWGTTSRAVWAFTSFTNPNVLRVTPMNRANCSWEVAVHLSVPQGNEIW